MSTKQQIVSDATLKSWPFSFDFNFACKDGQVTIATCKYYRTQSKIRCIEYTHLKLAQKQQNTINRIIYVILS